MKRFSLLMFALVLSACERRVQLQFGPRGLSSNATVSVELRIFPDAVCPADLERTLAGPPGPGQTTILATGLVDLTGRVSQSELVFPRGRRAVSIVTRDINCQILLLGCEVLDLGSSSSAMLHWNTSTDNTRCLASGECTSSGRCLYRDAGVSTSDGGSIASDGAMMSTDGGMSTDGAFSDAR